MSYSYRRYSTLLSLSLVSFVGSTISLEATAAPQQPKEILAKIQASHELINNVRIDSEWDCKFMENHSWEKQTLIWDDLGRRRLKVETRSITNGRKQNSNDPHVNDTLFDGELVSFAQYYPERDRVGKPGSNGSGYNPVIIGDASGPIKKDLDGHRNPFEYIRNTSIRMIHDGIREQRIQSSEHNGKVQLRVEHIPEPEILDAYSVITVDPRKNWSIESVQTYAKDGFQTQKIVYQYQSQDDGLWVPKSGEHQRFIPGAERIGETLFDWRFRVTNAIFNDPHFDESVFALKLSPDAAVSDTRYKVAYRIGDKEAYNTDLEQLAAQAKKDEDNFANHFNGEIESKGSTWRTTIIILNLVISAAIAGFVLYRRRQHS